LMRCGVASTLEVTISDEATTGEDLAHSVSVVDGDYVSIRCTSDGGPGPATAAWSTEFNSAIAGESLFMAVASVDNIYEEYAPTQGRSGKNDVRVNHQNPMPCAGTLKKARVLLAQRPGAVSDVYTFTLEIGGVDKSIVVTVTDPSTSGNDAVHTEAVVAGDLINWQIVPTHDPTNQPIAAISMVFVAATDGNSVIMGGLWSSATVNNAVRYIHLAQGATLDATEANVYSLISSCTITDFYVLLDGAPGVGKNYKVDVRVNGAAAGQTVTIADAATTGNDVAHTATPTDGQTCGIEVTPTNTPTARRVRWGLLEYNTPTGASTPKASPASKLMTAGAL